MEESDHSSSVEALSAAILRAKRHEGGLKIWPCLEVEPAWFQEISEEVALMRERRIPSDVSLAGHPSNWVGVDGVATQHSLFNYSGDTADFSADFNRQTQKKSFTDPSSPAIGRLVDCFADRLLNFRVNTLLPGSGLRPHEEPIVRDSKIVLRFHLPVFTNDGATLAMDDERFHFEPGFVYFFNKGCIHAAENLGTDPRCHILFDFWLDAWVFETMFANAGGPTPHPGLRWVDRETARSLCASTPVEIPNYLLGTSSGAILRASRANGTVILDKQPVNFHPDIVPADESIKLSGDWHPLEHWAGDTFRWVSGSGQFSLIAVDDGSECLEFELEPGPGAQELPLQVEIVDPEGCQLLTAEVAGRARLSVEVPVHRGAGNHFRIAARNGGRKVEGDPRVLDFRIFQIDRCPVQ